MDTFLRDLRYGVRTLFASPGYAAMVILTLAFGIGANTSIFSMINGVLLQPLPYREGSQLMVARQRALAAGSENIPFSVKEVIDYREQLGSLERE